MTNAGVVGWTPHHHCHADDDKKLIAAERARGALLGLAAGDRNGGPIRMAIMCIESALEVDRVNTRGAFRRYYDWWDPDVEADDKAFDTGDTLPAVFEMVKRSGADPEDAAESFHLQTEGRVAGINGAHRSMLLALCLCIDDEELPIAARADARLTHAHPLSGDAAAACATILRDLVKGTPWRDALASGRRVAPNLAEALRPKMAGRLAGMGGHATEVVAAAVHLVDEHRRESFDIALRGFLEFAGPDNYSPVIAGAWLGAMHGGGAIADSWLEENLMLGGSKRYKRQDIRLHIRELGLMIAQTWCGAGHVNE